MLPPLWLQLLQPAPRWSSAEVLCAGTGARPVRLLLGAGGATSCAAGWDGAVGDGRNSARGVGTAA
ncbi:MAG: hypothetical protein EBV06_15950 [Planctomycetia bacterium]|nr:hypothetical protein [Planctomycetia bacterium]